MSSDGEKPTSNATPTRDPDCFEVRHPHEDRMVEMCPPPGPKNVEPALREKYNDHMEERTTKQARGETADPVVVKIFVAVETDGAVDAVVQFLNDNGARLVSWSKEGDTTAEGGVSAVVDLQLLFAIGEIEGVQSVEEVRRYSRASFGNQQVPASAATILQADQWHDVGFTGTGVGVGVIDFDFRDFRTRIPASALSQVEFFCYDEYGVGFAGAMSTAPTAFAACETSDMPAASRPHGRTWLSR